MLELQKKAKEVVAAAALPAASGSTGNTIVRINIAIGITIENYSFFHRFNVKHHDIAIFEAQIVLLITKLTLVVANAPKSVFSALLVLLEFITVFG